MKKSFLIISLLASLLTAKDLSVNYDTKMVQPYVGISYHMYGLDKTGIENKNIGLNTGFLFNDDSKVQLSFFRDTVDETDVRYKVEVIDIKYEYSFNNFGKRRGFVVGSGFTRNKVDTITQKEVEIIDADTGAISKGLKTIENEAKSWYLSMSAGYEQKLGNNYIVDIKYNLNVLKFSRKTDMQKMNRVTISFKYLFD